MANSGEVILITGGSGFLGQHLIKLLQERDDSVREIRCVDLVPYANRLGHAETKPVVSYIGDIFDAETIEEAFRGGVDCVFHCASLVDFQFPPDFEQLERVNVNGTKRIVNLCIKHNIPRLVYTSSASVTLAPYMGRATFSVIINQTESKAKTPTGDNAFLIPGYPSSKLRAETIVLGAHKATLANGVDELLTVALRPTVMYGEEDQRFLPTIMKVALWNGNQIPKIAGPGGKHQMTYAGNVAWAHIRAKDTLALAPAKIGGLPIFVTDDTPIEDTTRFCQRISRASSLSSSAASTSPPRDNTVSPTIAPGRINLRPTWWSVPSFLSYFVAVLLECLMRWCVHPLLGRRLPFPPRALVAYAGSIILFSRLRASIHLDYEPIFNEEKSILNSANWYEKWYGQYINGNSGGSGVNAELQSPAVAVDGSLQNRSNGIKSNKLQ